MLATRFDSLSKTFDGLAFFQISSLPTCKAFRELVRGFSIQLEAASFDLSVRELCRSVKLAKFSLLALLKVIVSAY